VADQTSRRIQQRYDVRISVDFVYDGKEYQAQSRNMSVGGVFIETAAPLPYGSTVQVSFRVPAIKEPIEIESQVRWVEKDGGITQGVGLQFQGLRAKHVWALNKFFAGKSHAA